MLCFALCRHTENLFRLFVQLCLETHLMYLQNNLQVRFFESLSPQKTEKNSGNEQPETIWLLQLCISSSHCSQKVKKQKNKIFSKANKKWKSKLISFSDGAVVLVVWLVSHLGLIPCVEPEKQEAGSKCGKLLSEHEIISTNWLLLAQSELSFFNRN